jgi:hypothetical protein
VEHDTKNNRKEEYNHGIMQPEADRTIMPVIFIMMQPVRKRMGYRDSKKNSKNNQQ